MSDWKDEMRGERNTSEGNAKIQLYKRYYDISSTIQVAGAIDPNNSDSQVYNVESIDDALQRNAPFLNVCNDGTDNLYILASHGGTQTFSPENIIYPGDIKTYINVYELRLRSPTVGLPYRVSEYNIDRTCCPVDLASIDPTWIHGTEVTAPAMGTQLVNRTVSNGKTGLIYGFLISSQEANNFLISWTSNTIPRSIRIVFGSAGTTQDTESIPLNEGLDADANTGITITNINAGGVGAVYQARLLYKEV
jgi:hypothetical protein